MPLVACVRVCVYVCVSESKVSFVIIQRKSGFTFSCVEHQRQTYAYAVVTTSSSFATMELDFTVIALVASAISYVVYNLLYLIAQLWEAFATLFLGLYYVALFYGFMKARKSFLIVGTGLLALSTVILIGLFVFFMVEIFYSHSLVYQSLIYIKNMDEKQRVVGGGLPNVNVALSLGDAAGGMNHSCTSQSHTQKDTFYHDEAENSSEAPLEAMAIQTELDEPAMSDFS
ncbi:unnamed protein product [Angiostrongylus costaricensis]|uniref:DUF4203 domain-containing protein n=1 Tax=Angiostrongylus costaricensis TaxID=334426 RepID=A0A0R3PK20_ANGCS|nr:unnamed protein product [Angiostrongylus costaricensis]